MFKDVIFVYNDTKPFFIRQVTNTWFNGNAEFHAIARDESVTKLVFTTDCEEDLKIAYDIERRFLDLHIKWNGCVPAI